MTARETDEWDDPVWAELNRAVEGHPERDLIEARARERDGDGNPLWRTVTTGDDPEWVEWWQLRWPPDTEARGICIMRRPVSWMKQVSADQLARAGELFVDEPDEPPPDESR
jgi:hypothetical protein